MEKKFELPRLPRCVGIITSPTGAAVRDILSVLKRRCPQVPVIVYPAAVQGDAAPGELLRALETANTRAECDVLILGRGGGSLEDLWAFNDEALARAIARSVIPTISAVGHEIDFTIADFVADLRAPTPSGAAELVVPDQADWLQHLSALENRVIRSQRHLLDSLAQSVDWLQRRLSAASPARKLERQTLLLGSLQQRLRASMRDALYLKRKRSRDLSDRLLRHSPVLRLQRAESRLDGLTTQLKATMQTRLSEQSHALALAARALHSVSPLATLNRGYSILTNADGRALTDARTVQKGDLVHARLAHGRLTARVTTQSD